MSLLILQQISSLSEKLLRATQSYTNQTERAGYLENQCALLKEKVNDLLLKVAQKDEKHIKNAETTDSAVQTDDTSEAGFLFILHRAVLKRPLNNEKLFRVHRY